MSETTISGKQKCFGCRERPHGPTFIKRNGGVTGFFQPRATMRFEVTRNDEGDRLRLSCGALHERRCNLGGGLCGWLELAKAQTVRYGGIERNTLGVTKKGDVIELVPR